MSFEDGTDDSTDEGEGGLVGRLFKNKSWYMYSYAKLAIWETSVCVSVHILKDVRSCFGSPV